MVAAVVFMLFVQGRRAAQERCCESHEDVLMKIFVLLQLASAMILESEIHTEKDLLEIPAEL